MRISGPCFGAPTAPMPASYSSYYYPYIAFHLGHERIIYPALGIAPDEKVVSAAPPRVATALDVMERELQGSDDFLVGGQATLADFFLLPTMTTLSLTPEGAEMLGSKPLIRAWRERMQARPSAMKLMAEVAPHIGMPLEHARNWVTSHRPRY